VDMNLSPNWATLLEADGHSVIHWSSIGSPTAPDTEIMRWARDNGFISFLQTISTMERFCSQPAQRRQA
jgi:predicted nuclease of predicted toxin-antitoxin system